MVAQPTPSGLVGLQPRDPIGVRVSVGRKDLRTGAPVEKDRFYLGDIQTASHEFKTKSGGSYRSLARSLHPAFAQWNDAAAKGSERCRTLRGNLVHARLKDAALWNRAAQKLPEPHPNPASQRPACEGNGIVAIRFSGVVGGEEQFREIACPNQFCEFAMSGACKPFASLIFRLRWADDRFPELLAYWDTHGWNSARNLLGLFELVKGTKDVAPWEPEENWMPGLCEGAGIPAEEVSLFGLPFVMTVGEKTRASDERTPGGRRFPVVSFSPDGDLMQWLVLQAQQRRQVAAGRSPTLLPAAMGDPDVEGVRLAARAEFDPAAIEVVANAAPSGYLDYLAVRKLYDDLVALGVNPNEVPAHLAKEYGSEDTIPASAREAVLAWGRERVKG